MLQAADVDKLRCNFVSDVYEYFKSKKYSISCSNKTAIQSYIDFKLSSFNSCPLDVYDECYLQNIESKVAVKTCESQEFLCEVQAEFNITKTSKTTTYTTTLENKVNGSSFAVVEINNGLYPEASIDLVTRDNFGNEIQRDTITSGTAIINDVVTASDNYKLGGYTVLRKENSIANSANTYISSIRLYATDSAGLLSPGAFWDFDVSPLTSFFLLGTYTIPPQDLYFTSPNWTTAFSKVIANAVESVTGNINDVLVLCEKTPTGGIKIKTAINNNPTGIWYGLNTSDYKLVYKNDNTGTTTTLINSFPPLMESKVGVISTKTNVTLPDGTVKEFEVANTNISFPLSNIANFNLMFPSSNVCTPALSLIGDTVNADNEITLTVNSSPNQNFTTTWYDLDDVFISNEKTITLHNPESGVYSVVTTLESGCSYTTNITI